jgi:molybdate transport system ATP-binding protein
MKLVINGRIHRGECNLLLHEEFSGGDVVAVVGPNGVGKSTLLSTIAGIVPLEEGQIMMGTRIVDSPSDGIYVAPEDRKIGMMFQSLHLIPQFTALQNVALALRAQGMPKSDANSTAHKKLELVGAAHLVHRKALELSGGEAQRVALARAIAAEPDVLLLDEPLSAIDAGSREQLRSVLAEVLSGFPGVALLVSHDVKDLTSLATRILTLG